MLKQIVDVLQGASFYKGANTINQEGFPAFEREGWERFIEILFLGHTGNTFYVSSEDFLLKKVEDLRELIPQLVVESQGVEKVAELIGMARNEGLFRHVPIMALILLRKAYVYTPLASDPEFRRSCQRAFKDAFQKVILTGQDLKDYLDLSRALGEKWGRVAKKAMHRWMKERVNGFYALKYRNQIADAIAVSRMRVDGYPNRAELHYAYAVKKEMDLSEYINQVPQLLHAEEFKRLVREGNVEEALRHAQEGKLPADLMIGMVGNVSEPQIWRVIAGNMGTMQCLKYLNKLSSVLPEEELLPLVEKKIVVENLKKAKVFPYSVFVAWENVESGAVKEHLQRVVEGYIAAYNWGKWREHSYFIAPDVSGSMSGPYMQGVVPAKVAGFFSAVLASACGEREIYPWDTEVHPISTEEKSLIEVYSSVVNATGGGTAMGEPVRLAVEKKIVKDIFLIITDSEHWYGGYRNTFMRWWVEYKHKVNPKAKAVIVEVVGYGDSQVNEKFAEKYDVHTVFGWSDVVFRWIEERVL